MDSYVLSGATVVTPEKISAGTQIAVSDDRIASSENGAGRQVPLGEGFYVYPGLINAHDHMRGNYLPRIGPKNDNFYINWCPWDNDLKASGTYEERANITVEQMYYLSAYKSLFSGVTTVQDHFDHKFNSPYAGKTPVRILQEYCLAHEISSFELKWGEGHKIEHDRALEKDWPFITHLEEGFDAETMDCLGILDREGCLDSHDLLIHCIGFSDDDIKKVKKTGASVCWCPASNMLMFNVTAKIRKLLKAGVNVCLGTDSTASGSLNTLAEMKFARDIYRQMYGEDIPAKTLVEMVTVNPARALRLDRETGTIKPGMLADIAVFRAKRDDPCENLVNATMEDLALLIVAGRPVYGDYESFGAAFEPELKAAEKESGAGPAGGRKYTDIVVGGRRMFVQGDPAKLYRDIRKAVGFEKKLDFLPFRM